MSVSALPGPTISRPKPPGAVWTPPGAIRSRPDTVRTPPGAEQRPPHHTGKCPRIRLQLPVGDELISHRRRGQDKTVLSCPRLRCELGIILVNCEPHYITYILGLIHGMMMLHKLWGLILENCNIPEFWTAGVSFKCVKRLNCIVH